MKNQQLINLMLTDTFRWKLIIFQSSQAVWLAQYEARPSCFGLQKNEEEKFDGIFLIFSSSKTTAQSHIVSSHLTLLHCALDEKNKMQTKSKENQTDGVEFNNSGNVCGLNLLWKGDIVS